MKNKSGYWLVIGLIISGSISIISKNIPAGLFIGAGSGMLLMIISNLETESKTRK